MAIISPQDALAAQLEAWLSRPARWWAPFLPAQLCRAFEADRAEARGRAGALLALLGGGFAVLFYPTLTGAMPDMGRVLPGIWLGLAVPGFPLAAALILLRPPPMLRETLLALPTLLVAAALTYLFAESRAPGTTLYVAGMLLVILFPAVAQSLRFRVTIALLCAVLGLYAWGVMASPAVMPGEAPNMILLFAASMVYVLLANARMQAEQQRSFALTLRERLRQAALLHENTALGALALRDPLTGIANRRAYDGHLEQIWRDCVREGGRETGRETGRDTGRAGLVPGVTGLVLVDVDHFKAFNDGLGHPAGDACLTAIANCLRGLLPGERDLLARIGGEEFAAVLPGMSAASCADIAERMRGAVSALGIAHPDGGIVTISCGCASLPCQGAEPASLAALADQALYAAKAAGRNQVVLLQGPTGARPEGAAATEPRGWRAAALPGGGRFIPTG